jgi:hypothetical protein
MWNKLKTTAIMAAFLASTAGIAYAQTGMAPGAGGAAGTGYNSGAPGTGYNSGTNYNNGMGGAGTQELGSTTSSQGLTPSNGNTVGGAVPPGQGPGSTGTGTAGGAPGGTGGH